MLGSRSASGRIQLKPASKQTRRPTLMSTTYELHCCLHTSHHLRCTFVAVLFMVCLPSGLFLSTLCSAHSGWTLANYISQAPVPTGFQMDPDSGRHCQEPKVKRNREDRQFCSPLSFKAGCLATAPPNACSCQAVLFLQF